MKLNNFLFIIIIAVILLIFKTWFSFNSLSIGDWIYKFPQAINSFTFYPYAWDESFINGMGGNAVFWLPLSTYFLVTAALLFKYLNLPWEIIEKIVWFWPFILVSITGSFLLFKKWLLNNNILALISALIFTTNSYALMITGGGQMGVGMAYAFIPFVVLSFLNTLIQNSSKKSFKLSLIAGMVFSIQFLLDLRIAYVTLVFLGIYYLLFLVGKDFFIKFKKTFIYFFVIPALITLALHFFWLLPFVLTGANPLSKLGEAFTGPGIVKYLSFANLENTISLIHPNWPENIFGKVGFMRPEFLFLPLLAFSPLLFISKIQNKKKIIVLTLLALIGAFLAKGANDPFGQLYIWMFTNVPGFIMFRDSTKWYSLIAITFSLLIPYCIYELSEIKIFEKFKKYSVYILTCIFIILWIFTIRQAYMGELGGTFTSRQAPREYRELTEFISSNPSFFRSLWVPKSHQFSYFSNLHPIVPAEDFFSSYATAEQAKKIEQNLPLLSEVSIKYVIVPSDTQGKIFLTDRKYDDNVYKKTVEEVKNIQFIKEVKRFGKIVVFEVPDTKEHVWSTSNELKLKFKTISLVEYQLSLTNAKKDDLIVLSESYDSGWIATEGDTKITSKPYNKLFNSFKLQRDGNYSLKVYYSPQKYVEIGLVASLVTFIAVILFFILSFKRSKNNA